MKYTVYKITNTLNNKIYIGVHKTNNLDDDYMGSGLALKRAINKYGVENFTKEYIAIFDNSEDMFNMEAELVNEAFVEDKSTYNIKLGGCGGFDFINDNSVEYLERQKQSNIKGNMTLRELYKDKQSDWYKARSEKLSKTTKYNQEIGLIKKFVGNEFLDKTHTEETKAKIGKANSKHQKGKGNSQYGTMWIYNLDLKESKKIKKDELPEYESLGWLKGRKMKF